jgi:MFS family permease
MSTAANDGLPHTGSASTAAGRRTLSQGLAFAAVAISLLAMFFAAGAPTPLFSLLAMRWGFAASLLTIAFAIYAIALLVSLLVAGSLSDYIGRRPVLIGALVVEAISMLVFLFAPNIGWIIAARIVQGFATGAAAGAFTAAVVEFAPERHKKLGTLAGSIAPTSGLALGALWAGLAVQFAPMPGDLIFAPLAIIFVLGIVALVFSTETVSPRAGAMRSLMPRVFVTSAARGEFTASTPIYLSTWMLGGLYLGLVPTLVLVVFHVDSGLVNGIAIVALIGTGAVAGYVLGSVDARFTGIMGQALVVVGAATVLLSVVSSLFSLFFIGSVIAGVGFGASFSAAVRLIAPLAGPHERAELFAAVYVLSYLAFSLPVIVAGQLIAPLGLMATTTGYVAVVVMLAALGAVAQTLRLRIVRVPATS